MIKGSNLNPALVARLRENTAAHGGLHHLDLSCSNIGPKELTAVADCIKYNCQICEGMAPLISIDLSGNAVCGVDFMLLGTYDSDGLNDLCNNLINMSKMSRLRKLILTRNHLDTRAFAIISNFLINGPQSLLELTARACGGDFAAAEKLAEGMKANKTLTYLDIRQNHFGAKGAEHIGDFVANNSKLKHLNISECDLGSPGIVAVCKGLMNNETLEVLSMADNNCSDAGCEAIANLFRGTKRLRQVDIQENHIGMEGISLIAKSLTKNRTLIFLGLQWNNISNEGAARLGEALMYNNTLRSMHLLGNHIDLDGITLIIDSSLACNEKPIDLDLAFAYPLPLASSADRAKARSNNGSPVASPGPQIGETTSKAEG